MLFMKKIKINRILFLLVISLMFFKNANSSDNAELETKELKRLSQIIKNYSFVEFYSRKDRSGYYKKKDERDFLKDFLGKSLGIAPQNYSICKHSIMERFYHFPDQKNVSVVVLPRIGIGGKPGGLIQETQYKISLLTYKHQPAIKFTNYNTNVVIPVKITRTAIYFKFPKKDGTSSNVYFYYCKNFNKDLAINNIAQEVQKKIQERKKNRENQEAIRKNQEKYNYRLKNDPDFRKKEQFLRKKRLAKCKSVVSLIENSGYIDASSELFTTYRMCKQNGF